jgi:hypothetical protein
MLRVVVDKHDFYWPPFFNQVNEVKLTMALRHGVSAALLLTVSLIPSTHAFAERIYKWVDDQGTTHYGARPPIDRPSQEIRINTPQAGQSDASTEPKSSDAQSKAKDEQPVPEKIDKRNKEAIARNCDIYRQNLKVMNESGRVRVQETDGQMRMLPEEERQEKIKQAQEYLKQYCQ